MKIIIDHRERRLIKILQALNCDNNYNLEIEVKNLPLGDIVFMEGEKELLIIERKTIVDLAASITDGRYNEQSFRLTHTSTCNHNIIYLIEGTMGSLTRSRISPETLHVTMFSLQYFKGFTIARTLSIIGSAEWICRAANKIKREKTKVSYDDVDNKHEPKEYTSVVKKVKKENIRPDNIGSIILSQLPSISSTTACAIMSKYKSLYELLCSLKENPNCLDKITYQTKNKTRHISKTSIKNIKKYLYNNKKE